MPTKQELWIMLEKALTQQGPDLFEEYLRYWSKMPPPYNDFAAFIVNVTAANEQQQQQRHK